MASFKIKNASVNAGSPDTLVLTMEYTFDDSRKSIVDVQVFRGSSLQQVNDAIDNRLKSEWSKLKASDLTQQLVDVYKGLIDVVYPASQE